METDLYLSERFTRISAWIDLLLLATHKERAFFIRGIKIKLKAGELCRAQLSLAERWKWDVKTVKKFLSELEFNQMVETKTNNVTTIISIVNWQEYQVLRNRTVYESLNNGDQNGEQTETKTETNNNDNNVNKNFTPKKKRKPKSTLDVKKNSILYSVVYLFSKIQNRLPESTDFSFIKTLLKLKQNDNIIYVCKCLMLCYIINSLKQRIDDPKFKGILYNSYRDFSYSDFLKNRNKGFGTALSNEYESFN